MSSPILVHLMVKNWIYPNNQPTREPFSQSVFDYRFLVSTDEDNIVGLTYLCRCHYPSHAFASIIDSKLAYVTNQWPSKLVPWILIFDTSWKIHVNVKQPNKVKASNNNKLEWAKPDVSLINLKPYCISCIYPNHRN